MITVFIDKYKSRYRYCTGIFKRNYGSVNLTPRSIIKLFDIYRKVLCIIVLYFDFTSCNNSQLVSNYLVVLIINRFKFRIITIIFCCWISSNTCH